ncbi:mediator complex subunit 28 [Brevipalpus obovatus]|uniref:mediator complex subunit 28 n=1 Tax=Brevipalpus obovatus TaxID=246614 RepID=UPI003D9E55E2
MMASRSGQSLLDDFHHSYVNLFALLTPPPGPDNHNIHESEEIKVTVDQGVNKFIDTARAMETYFLQNRLMYANLKPEQVVAEEIAELDNEIMRKDEVIKKFYDKLDSWQNKESFKSKASSSSSSSSSSLFPPPQPPSSSSSSSSAAAASAGVATTQPPIPTSGDSGPSSSGGYNN